MIYSNYLKYVSSITSMNKKTGEVEILVIQNAAYKVYKKSSQTKFIHGKLNEPESIQFLHIGQDFTLKQLCDF